MGATLLPDLAIEIFIPVCAVIGIAFALFQWLLVSKVKLSAARYASSGVAGKNGFNDYLIEEEEGINDHNAVQKCAEIQNAISEDPVREVYSLDSKIVGSFILASSNDRKHAPYELSVFVEKQLPRVHVAQSNVNKETSLRSALSDPLSGSFLERCNACLLDFLLVVSCRGESLKHQDALSAMPILRL